MVDAPDDYPWSGHRAYLGKELFPWLTTEWMLEQFGKSAAKARAGYTAFVLDGLGEEHRPEFHGGGEDSRLLGDDSFVDGCLSRSGSMPVRVTVQEIADKVCLAYKIDEATLKAQSQQRVASEARAMVGWLTMELRCATLSEVTRFVNRDVGSISSSVRRLSYRMQETPELADRVRSLKAALEEAT